MFWIAWLCHDRFTQYLLAYRKFVLDDEFGKIRRCAKAVGGGVEKIYFNPQSSWSTGCAWANYFQYISQMWWHMISRNIWLKKGCFLCYCDYVVYRWHCWRPKFFIWRYLFMVIGALWFNEMKNFFRVNLRPSQCLWEFSCKWEFFLQILRELWFYGINFVTFLYIIVYFLSFSMMITMSRKSNWIYMHSSKRLMRLWLCDGRKLKSVFLGINYALISSRMLHLRVLLRSVSKGCFELHPKASRLQDSYLIDSEVFNTTNWSVPKI